MRVVLLRGWFLVSCLVASAAFAQDVDLEDAKKFLAGRPELTALVSKATTKVGPGVYQVDLGSPDPQLFLVKQGNAWVAALTVNPKKLALTSLIPENVLGGVTLNTAFLVVGGSAGSLSAKGLGGGLQTSVAAFGKDVAYAPGVNLYTQLQIGEGGTLGQLKNAGLLPPGPLWLTGTTGQGLADSLLGGGAPDLKAIDFSLTLAVGSMVPAPFNLIASPKLTLGDAQFSFSRAGAVLTLRGEQIGTKLVINDKTFLIPKTSLTFNTQGGSYDITVEGSTIDKRPVWSDAFGLRGVDLKSITVGGTISSTKTDAQNPPIKGFALSLGGKVAIDRKDFDGRFTLSLENNALKELSLELSGDLNLGFTKLPNARDFTLKQFGFSISPTTMQAALSGELNWRNLNGRAAVVLSQQPMLFLRLKNLDLSGLVVKSPPPGWPALPPLDVLLTLGMAANAGDVSILPSAAQQMIDEVTGATGGKVAVTNGLTLVTRIDAEKIGADKYGTNGPVLLAGGVDVIKGSFRIAASLPSIPPIPGLPQGFGVEAPEFFLAVDQKSGAPVASFGLGLRLLLPVDRQVLAFKGSLAASTAGSFSFTGALESNWVNPVGLEGLTILAPVVVSVGVSVDGSVDLGFQAGMAIANQTYNPMAMCLNIQAAVPPVPKKLAFKFKGTEFGPRVQMQVMGAFVKSAANGPLLNAVTDPASRLALGQVGPQVDHITDSVDALNLPLLSFTQVDVALTTPGVTCDIPAIEGMGIKLKGTARMMGKPIGSVDSYVNLTQGLKIDSKINDLNFLDLVALSNARLDVLAPLPGAAPAPSAASLKNVEKLKARLSAREAALKKNGAALKKEKDPDDKADLADERQDLEEEIGKLKQDIARGAKPDLGHFYLTGRAQVLRASAELNVGIDRTHASFEFGSELADLGAVKMSAMTEGEDLSRATDFVVNLTVTTDAEEKFLKNLGAALRASAAARKQASAGLNNGSDDALKAAQAEFDKLDRTTGKDFRQAKKDLKKAKKKFKKADRALEKAKDKCEEDLGVAKDLCKTLDVAKDAVKASKKSLNVAQDALKAIKKSSDFAQMSAAAATVATIKAGKAAGNAVMTGWSAVDSVGQMVADGGDVIDIEEMALDGSLRNKRGSLTVTASVGDQEIEQVFEVNLGSGDGLDLKEFAEKVADEITVQATQDGSKVWTALRKKK